MSEINRRNILQSTPAAFAAFPLAFLGQAEAKEAKEAEGEAVDSVAKDGMIIKINGKPMMVESIEFTCQDKDSCVELEAEFSHGRLDALRMKNREKSGLSYQVHVQPNYEDSDAVRPVPIRMHPVQIREVKFDAGT